MDFKELKSFVCVVDNESVTIAAKKLFMTQPAVSTHLRLLEKELNEKLFRKEKKRILPTTKGMELYEYAKKILTLESDLHKNINSDIKILKIGVSSVPSLLCLPEILGSYKKKHKDINIQIYQNDSKKILDALKNDLIDIGLIGMDIKEKDISSDSFYKDTMVLIAPNTKEYKNMLKMTSGSLINSLIKKPFIMREDGSGSKKNIIRFLEKLNISLDDLNIIGEINSQDTIVKLVTSGLGVSIVSKKIVNNKDRKVLFYEFPYIKNERNLNVIYKPKKLKKYIKSFVAFTKDFYKNKK